MLNLHILFHVDLILFSNIVFIIRRESEWGPTGTQILTTPRLVVVVLILVAHLETRVCASLL